MANGIVIGADEDRTYEIWPLSGATAYWKVPSLSVDRTWRLKRPSDVGPGTSGAILWVSTRGASGTKTLTLKNDIDGTTIVAMALNTAGSPQTAHLHYEGTTSKWEIFDLFYVPA